MSEQMPDGLQLADKLLAESEHVSEAVDCARDAIRAEHAQRVTLQRHACDLAQRVADLEAERVKDAEAIATYRGQMQSLQGYAERLEDELDALHPKHDKLEAENQRLEAERYHTAAHVASIARQLGDDALQVDDIAVRVLGLVAERDELRARLAEIEAQEPVAFARYSVHSRKPASVDLVSEYEEWQHDTGLLGDHWGGNEPLYARPVPAQAVPDADSARFRWLCEDHDDRETREQCRSLIDRLPVMSYSDAVMSIDAAMAAAPEHKA